MAKAKEEKFNELHNLVTDEFLKRVRSGEATTQDLKAKELAKPKETKETPKSTKE